MWLITHHKLYDDPPKIIIFLLNEIKKLPLNKIVSGLTKFIMKKEKIKLKKNGA